MVAKETLKSWEGTLEDVKDILFSLEPEGNWANKQIIRDTYAEIQGNLNEDIDFLSINAAFIFSKDHSTDDLTAETVDLLRHWYLMNHAPSLLSLCMFAVENFQIDIDGDLKQALVMACVLGEVPNDLSYHSTLHYKKVVLQMIRLISIHNGIYKDTDNFCDGTNIAFLLMASCIHDLGHDGKGNTLKGVYHQARLERISYAILVKYFNAIGFKDTENYQKMMDDLRLVLLCTDTSPMGDPASFANQMKTAYRVHFLNQKSGYEGMNLDPEVRALETDEKLTVMALLLHEADMATSSGLNYEITSFETTLFYREINQPEAKPSNVIDFMNTICQRQVLSSAGQKLYSANMARILALAEKEIKAGNSPFPEPEHSNFLLLHGEKPGDDTPKTIN
ncbi:hypothetical protein N9Z27_01880 [Alphaproteobacteria bacterium]|nr:hypothetical protein [Alphaproteobacteria bacterium]